MIVGMVLGVVVGQALGDEDAGARVGVIISFFVGCFGYVILLIKLKS